MNKMNYPDRVIKNFSRRIDFPENPETSDECWNWTGGCPGRNTRTHIYGQIGFTINSITHYQKSHRFSYEYYYGPILNDLHVLHTCDNTLCVNPKHLWLGTNKDNVDDKVRKNRHAHGETIGKAILTEKEVLNIYNYCINTDKNVEYVANIFNIQGDHVKHIINGITWKHTYKELSIEDRLKMKSILDSKCTSCLNKDMVYQIRYHDLNVMRISDIAKKYKVSVQTIYHIRNKQTWSHI